MRELSAPVLAVVVALSVYDRRSREFDLPEPATSLMDDILIAFSSPRLNPHVIRMNGDPADDLESEYRILCAETLQMFEAIAPLVRVLTEA